MEKFFMNTLYIIQVEVNPSVFCAQAADISSERAKTWLSMVRINIQQKL